MLLCKRANLTKELIFQNLSSSRLQFFSMLYFQIKFVSSFLDSNAVFWNHTSTTPSTWFGDPTPQFNLSPTACYHFTKLFNSVPHQPVQTQQLLTFSISPYDLFNPSILQNYSLLANSHRARNSFQEADRYYLLISLRIWNTQYWIWIQAMENCQPRQQNIVKMIRLWYTNFLLIC